MNTQLVRRYVPFLVAVLLLIASTVLGEEIKIGGGGAPLDGIINPCKAAFEKETGIKLNIIFSNATIAFKQLLNNEVETSTAGQSYEDLLVTAKKANIEVKDPASHIATTIGRSSIFTIIHPGNPVSKLSKEQLKDIFTGKISNWKDVGGADAPIIVVLSKINPATNGVFSKLALDNQPYLNDVLEAGRFEDLREKVAANPEAIGFGPGYIRDKTVKAVETPDFSRPVIMVTNGKPAPKIQKLIDFINTDGKKYIKE
ncbi:MAG TPA: substrate-binding domain-containing protein [Desulfuromonadaceae bacterium]|jgi:phosphate transport system substrate-binding protein